MLITFKDKIVIQRSWTWWRWMFTILNVSALILSVILSWHHLNGGAMIGCNGSSSCDDVLSSQWSMIAGVLPISGLAVGTYLTLFAASFFIGPSVEVPIQQLAWSSMLILAGSIAGCAIWFTIVQKWMIGKFCIYCMSIHSIGLILTALIIWKAIKEINNNLKDSPVHNFPILQKIFPHINQNILRPMNVLGKVLIGLVLAGVLVVFQISFTPSTIYSDGKSQEIISVLDYNTVPIVGSPDAPYVVTLLFDYQCSHCQKIHLLLDETILRYKGKLAFALCPVPLNSHCNPYIPKDVDVFKNSCELAKIGLAVWLAKREAYSTFENWMYTFTEGDSWRPRNLEAARAKAVELVGQARFDIAWTDPWIEKYLQTSIMIYSKTLNNGNGGIPKMIYGSQWVIAEPRNVDELIMILQNSLGVPKP
jgi:uncharacterized membrane protein